MLYLDTSVVVPLFVNEDISGSVQRWASAQRTNMALSEWVSAEFVSALALKMRTGELSMRNRDKAISLFDKRRSGFRTFPFESRFFMDARAYIADHHTSLRASDALHLAIAAAHSATLCTRDRRFADAAIQIGHAVELV